MSSQMRQDQNKLSKGEQLNILYVLARAYAATVTPFLRYGSGVESPGAAGLIACVFLIFVAANTRDVGMWWYFLIWITAIACQRLTTFRLIREGKLIHSQYSGYPVVITRLFKVTQENWAKTLEVPFVMAIGAGLVFLDVKELQTVGKFIFTTAFALAIVRAIEMQLNMARVRQMNDAMIENQALNEFWRGGRKDY